VDYDDEESRLAQIIEPDGDRKVMIEDDGVTCYAYYYIGEKIAAHAWLYNVDPPSPLLEYADDDPAPPQNSPEHIADVVPTRLDADADIRCTWRATGVDVYVAGLLTATFDNGEKPGRSRLVLVDSALALRLPRA
jgi:hypothetical protein